MHSSDGVCARREHLYAEAAGHRHLSAYVFTNTSATLLASQLWAAATALLVLAASSSPAAARSLDAAPSSAPSGSHSLSKRSLFDPACTGIYDRQLGLLCDDCYNVFREPKVATGCRSNCYYNLIFLDCLEYLIPSHLQEEHMSALQTVGK
ncbi:crustacean hyperglycemic hormones 4-like [Penaeus vannamei]|uniref:crustacean hyperglycemic hormones 4-like n=1 Tax=Penaeus vannamei TaxID=6689 RepID=UPI00387F41DD